MASDTIFYDQDFSDFQGWLKLKMQDVTWQGKFQKEFDEFWQTFFLHGASLEQINERFLYAREHVKVGPLATWFKWLRRKFIIYTFITRQVSILELSDATQIDESDIALIIRDFLISKYPQEEDIINEVVKVGNITSPNVHDRFKDVLIKSGLKVPDDGDEDDILTSLEVTLYDEWQKFLKFMKRDLLHEGFDLGKLREKASMRKQKRFFKEVVTYFFIGGLLMFGVNKLNNWYEIELAKKIEIFELDFKWLNNTLRFKSTEDERGAADSFVAENIEDIEKAEASNQDDVFIEEERYEVESDVMLTSLDAIPRNIAGAGLQQSIYEEENKTNYRDTRLGNKTVYRVLMKSVDPEVAKAKLNPLLEKFSIKKIGNVAPGTSVPGGIYYNLHVPVEFLKEFLGAVLETEEGVLYENRSRGRNPPGMSRVFVWIKQI